MINTSLHFSSESDEWGTPQDFFDKQNHIHKFTLDVCATRENAKCVNFFTKDDDGLLKNWNGVCWMNPPYGRGIKAFCQKEKLNLRKQFAPVAACKCLDIFKPESNL